MHEILWIFRKDVRHLWPQILAVLAVTGCVGWLNAALPGGILFPLLLDSLWTLACLYLCASVIQEERLPGHEQYWLTRPFSRSRLLQAKLMFLVCFLALPVLAADVFALAFNRVSPLRWALPLLFAGLVVPFAVGLIGAALGTVTESLVQYLCAILAISGLVVAALIMGDTGRLRWGNTEWVRNLALGAIVWGAAIAVVVIQYGRRNTILSRGVLAAAVLVAAAGPFLGDWHRAFALEGRLAGGPIDPSAVRLSFDVSHLPAGGYGVGSYGPGRTEQGIAIPILVTGIPDGAEVVNERLAATIQAPDGRAWSSAWSATGGIANTKPLEDSRLLRSDGSYWQYLNVDLAFYREIKDTPVRVETSAALTLLGGRQSAPVRSSGRTGLLPGDAICSVGRAAFQNLLVSCAWPFRAPARSYVRVRSLSTGQTLESLLDPPGSYSPLPLNGSLWEPADAGFSDPPAPLELQLETWQALAHFERRLEIQQIRLSDYAIRRITDSQ